MDSSAPSSEVRGRCSTSFGGRYQSVRILKQSAGVGEWVDAMVRIEGPAAWALEAVSLSLTVAVLNALLKSAIAA